MPLKQCAICEEQIKYKWSLCPKHYYEYGLELDWVQALIELRNKELGLELLDQRHGKQSYEAYNERRA